LTLFAGREKRLLLPVSEFQPYFNSSRTINFPDLSDNFYEQTRYTGVSYQKSTINIRMPYFLGHWDGMTMNSTKLIWKRIVVEDYLMANITDGNTTTNGALSFSRANEDVLNNIFEARTTLRFRSYRFGTVLTYRYNDLSEENLTRFYPKHLLGIRPTYSDLFDFITISLGYYYQSSQVFNEQEISSDNHRLDLNMVFRINHFFKNSYENNFSINIGMNNLTNDYEQNGVIGAENPFGSEYDSSLNWRNTTGFNAYFGVKMSF